MEQVLDDFLDREDRYAEEDGQTRPFAKRVLPCWGRCPYWRIHEWNPETERWDCTECGVGVLRARL
uniref:Uncharacterized protein n=1 Tax=viral metagenome TaxID=1070528 RepID=A0A6M3X5F0_9ZZZZ